MSLSANAIAAILIAAFWSVVLPLIAIQNAEVVVLKLLTLQSVSLPLGLVLALSVATGMVGTIAVRLLWTTPSRRRPTFYEEPLD
ncbi:MAG: DUF1049 domain-containing protein [Synechococcales cyanobacterium K44_A2020_017]|nr:DUF1049 domain-containing protein [Synechococcales cyanobacterium K32_A2020_035]MBF2093241.1 DUF1049 domain-containing protein [Synechococcales cyanobacterium K44_A2020_017]